LCLVTLWIGGACGAGAAVGELSGTGTATPDQEPPEVVVAPTIDDQATGDSAPAYPNGLAPAAPVTPPAREGEPPVAPPQGPSNPLSVPYFYQYNNRLSPGSTCGATSAAMVMRLYGVNLNGQPVTPDALVSRNGVAQFQSPEGIAQMLQREVGFAQYSRTGTRTLIRRQIDAGRPVIIHGYFTAPGHIMVVVGYDDAKQQWILNDPAGRWSGRLRNGGYSTTNPTEGQSVPYSYQSFSDAVLGHDGDIWMSTAAKTSFRL
jgi:hypothetical protein